MRFVVKALVGLVFGVLATLALTPAFAAAQDGGQTGPIIMLVCVIVVTIACIWAPTIRRAFGRAFLFLGAALLMLPISTFFLAGRAFNETVSGTAASDQAFAAVGAGAGVAMVTGVATFFGLILGSIAMIIGLVLALGGRREVVVVQR